MALHIVRRSIPIPCRQPGTKNQENKESSEFQQKRKQRKRRHLNWVLSIVKLSCPAGEEERRKLKELSCWSQFLISHLQTINFLSHPFHPFHWYDKFVPDQEVWLSDLKEKSQSTIVDYFLWNRIHRLNVIDLKGTYQWMESYSVSSFPK